MTANRRVRRRSTWIALVGAVVALAAVAVLGWFAVDALADSRAGRDAGVEAVVAPREFPWTSTALVGVVDDEGNLRSTVVAVVRPEGRGGTIVSVSPSADAGAGNAASIRPLATVFAVDGPEAWRAAMEQLTGLSFDVAEVADAQRLAELVEPLGELTVEIPYDFTNAANGLTYEAGAAVLEGPEAIAVLTAGNAQGPEWQLDPGRDAVWSAVASRVGAGIGSLEAGVEYDAAYPPPSLDAFLDALFAAPVAHRALSSVPLLADQIAGRVPAEHVAALGDGWEEAIVAHRRSEAILMSASIAPGRVGAPLDGPTVRLVSGFTDDDAATIESSRADLLVETIDVLVFFGRSNVVSVDDAPGTPVPDTTRIFVSDEALVDEVWELFDGLFGEMQVVPSDRPVTGVDLEIVLGRQYLPALQGLRQLAEAQAADVEGSDT